MMMRLVMIVVLLAQPLPVRVCRATCATKPAPTSCSRPCTTAAKPRCCKATCKAAKTCGKQQVPASPCAFCPNAPREPVSPPSNPRPVNDQPVVVSIALAGGAGASETNLATTWADPASAYGGAANHFRQACLCVWLI